MFIQKWTLILVINKNSTHRISGAEEMKKYIFLSVIAILFLLSNCKAQNIQNTVTLDKNTFTPASSYVSTTKTNLLGIVTVNRLRLRSSNDVYAKTIRYLDQGDMLNIILKDEKRIRINNMEDYWYQVDFNGTKGWIFGYYLEIYTDYLQAQEASNRYKGSRKNSNKEENNDRLSVRTAFEFGERFINNNLLFLSDGQLLEVTDFVNGKANVVLLSTPVESYIVDTESNGELLYYIGKQQRSKALFRYDFKTKAETLLLKDVEKMTFDFRACFGVVVGISTIADKKNTEQWTLRKINLQTGEATNFASIEKANDENIITDPLYNSLLRERGRQIYLELDYPRGVVYFRPPEEDKVYLISLEDGNFIRTTFIPENDFVIDVNRSLNIERSFDDTGKMKYSLQLHDNLSGYTKEIIKTSENPINFVLHKYKDLMAVTMLQMQSDIPQNKCYPSFIYIMSLSNYSIIPVSTSGNSYQPQWRR